MAHEGGIGGTETCGVPWTGVLIISTSGVRTLTGIDDHVTTLSMTGTRLDTVVRGSDGPSVGNWVWVSNSDGLSVGICVSVGNGSGVRVSLSPGKGVWRTNSDGGDLGGDSGE